jgi:glycosyltransferase involved in cell wall biosynthesis
MLVHIVIPVFNEEEELRENTLKLYNFLKNSVNFKWSITIADNASNDNTQSIGEELAKKYSQLKYVRLPLKGRGRAVKNVWNKSKADILAYMDIDLSTDLSHLPNMVNALQNEYDIAIGSRLLKDSVVEGRTAMREFISRSLNLLVKIMFQTKFSDAQCGFKAITKKTARQLLPQIRDNGWFMDSELLIIADKAGFKIYEEPVKWVDNPGSTVRVLPTAWGDFRGLMRLFVTRPWKMIKSNENGNKI